MIKIDKTVTIKYICAGIYQYADIYFSEGKIVSKKFNPSWIKPEEIPSLDNLETIEEILEVIRNFSKYGDAEIFLINDTFPEIYEKNINLKETTSKVSKFLEDVFYNYFIETIAPILNKNNWKISRSHIGMPVICKIDKNGKLDNIPRNERKDKYIIDMLCYDFLKEVLDIKHNECTLRTETNHIHIDGFIEFYNKLNENTLKLEGYYIPNN